MEDRPNLSVVICYRDWGIERLRLAVESHLLSNAADQLEVLVSDFGSSADRKAEDALSDLPVRFVYSDTDEPWSRARALNAGVVASRGEFVLAWDADIVASPELHGELLRHFEAQKQAVYVFQCRDLDAAFDEHALRERVDREGAIPRDALRDHSAWRPRWGMGIAAFPREAFDRVRGYDERFIIWGGEDRDLVHRLGRAGLPARWIESECAEIFHIYDTPSADATDKTDAGNEAVRRNHEYVREDRTIHRNLVNPRYFRTDRPLVSVVVATYNRGTYIRESIDSVLNQTFADFELIVVNDGSTDDTGDILEQYGDERLTVVHQSNAGVAAARNTGMEKARGHFIAVHDDDDIMVPDRLEAHLAALTGNCGGSYGGWIDFDDETGRFVEINPGKAFSEDAIAHAGKVLLHPTVMTTRWIARNVPYDVRYRGGSDFNWMMTIAANVAELVHTGKFLILRRVHGASLTASGSNQKHASKAAVRSLFSGVGRSKIQESRRVGRSAEPGPISATQSVSDLYRHLPEHLQDERIHFSATVDTAALETILREIGDNGHDIGIDHFEPLSAAGVRVEGLWRISGFSRGEDAVVKIVKPHAGQCTFAPKPAPLELADIASEEMARLLRNEGRASRKALMVEAFPETIWQVLPEVIGHFHIGSEDTILVGRARNGRAAEVRELDRMLSSFPGSQRQPESLTMLEAKEGAIPVYRMKSELADSTWLKRWSRDHRLTRVGFAFYDSNATTGAGSGAFRK